MLHIGNRIKEVLTSKGESVNWLAERIPCERSNVYNLFRRQNIGVDLLFKISLALDHDFFLELSNDLKTKD